MECDTEVRFGIAHYQTMRVVLVFMLTVVLLLGCDSTQCRNTLPLFDTYSPKDNEYKRELIRQLEHIGYRNVRYTIAGIEQSWNRQYMKVTVSGSELCATMMLDITGSIRLSNFVRVGGVSYAGSELQGLVYRVDSAGGDYQFHFIDVSKIVD